MDMQKFVGYGSGVEKSISAHLWRAGELQWCTRSGFIRKVFGFG